MILLFSLSRGRGGRLPPRKLEFSRAIIWSSQRPVRAMGGADDCPPVRVFFVRIGPREWFNNCTENVLAAKTQTCPSVPMGYDCRVFDTPVNAGLSLLIWTIVMLVESFDRNAPRLSFAVAVYIHEPPGCELGLLFSSNYEKPKPCW